MSEKTIREPVMGLTFEKVWAMFQETDRKMQEMALQTDRKMQETDRIVQETALQMRETDRKISKLGSKLGDLIEEMIFPNIMEKFNHLGYAFGRAATNVRYRDARGEYIAEVDILLENGDVVLAVEVKTTLTNNDVRDHLVRMEKLRSYADEHQDKRKLLGAAAGAIASEEVKSFAIKSGFFVLEQSGDTIRISVPKDFKPREW
ncbi:MAG: hypothetical protein LBI90_00120 [Treponema sp.]|jgi:Holliday junction resolvase-like predicted endonuclease|nr:hypothetical protein [Treponema sp.]